MFIRIVKVFPFDIIGNISPVSLCILFYSLPDCLKQLLFNNAAILLTLEKYAKNAEIKVV